MTLKVAMSESKSQHPIISVTDLTVGYGEEAVIRGVSFDVSQGEVLAVLGRSGCGKTTLFKALIGLLEPEEGEVVIDGDAVVSIAEGGSVRVLRKIGVLFQSAALFSSMTLAENVALPLMQYTSFPDRTIAHLVSVKLAEVGLAGYEGSLPSEISGGMRRRAGLARAMALDPKILFFDEPSAGLDPVTSAELDSLIIRINRSLDTTMIIVTHELASIMAVAHRVIMLDGEEKNIIADGVPSELMEKTEDPRVKNFFSRSPSRAEPTVGTGA